MLAYSAQPTHFINRWHSAKIHPPSRKPLQTLLQTCSWGNSWLDVGSDNLGITMWMGISSRNTHPLIYFLFFGGLTSCRESLPSHPDRQNPSRALWGRDSPCGGQRVTVQGNLRLHNVLSQLSAAKCCAASPPGGRSWELQLVTDAVNPLKLKISMFFFDKWFPTFTDYINQRMNEWHKRLNCSRSRCLFKDLTFPQSSLYLVHTVLYVNYCKSPLQVPQVHWGVKPLKRNSFSFSVIHLFTFFVPRFRWEWRWDSPGWSFRFIRQI